MKFLINTVFIVIKLDLLFALDCLINNLNIIEKRLIIGLAPIIDRENVEQLEQNIQKVNYVGAIKKSCHSERGVFFIFKTTKALEKQGLLAVVV